MISFRAAHTTFKFLAFGLFIAIVATLIFLDQSWAQDAVAAAPPACDAKTLTACTPNSGDTAWMLTSVALVLMMTIPGLGLFYGGMVRKKNVGDTVVTSFAITCLITVLFTVLTYSLAFRAGLAVHRRPRSRLLARHFERYLQGRRQSQSARADHPRNRLHMFPNDLRDHHAGADRGGVRRTHEVLGDVVVHRTLGDLRVRADRALGLGARRIHEQH